MEFKLIIKKISDTLTEEEKTIFNQWYNESEVHKAYFKQVKKQLLAKKEVVDIEAGWKSFETRMHIVPKVRFFSNYRKIAVAASIALLLGLTAVFLLKDKKAIVEKPSAFEIGTDKAVLTLEDGSMVELGIGKRFETSKIQSIGEEIVYQVDKNNEVKEKEIAYNILSVPRGGQFFIKLSDGTKVWLNSDSRLKYPVEFTGDIREVELEYGEAYFEVTPSTKNQGKHFIVQSRKQKIEVLGTQFNLKSYKEENTITTTLVEGKVLITNTQNGKQAELPVLNQLQFNLQQNEFTISPVASLANEISWKEGFFKFNDKSLKDIMTVLSRWYNTEILFEDPGLQNALFNGVFSRNQSIEAILNIIQQTGEANYRIEEGKIVITKN